ncbi:lipopolysaccharide biosynthesis protein [uncultured Pseudokineococcus sp.]|uniref:lipopolysaccharide biosynthesis protein n=1 Tax=uncultured Pseudokineococcus sp. TaxID=1642928 RepID=UPI002638C92E|nr:polysaccharide biosynthesis C-terminal domain-containing protein [uncultured Pseudokineococcus sp.]
MTAQAGPAEPSVDAGDRHLRRVARGGAFSLVGAVVSAVLTLAFTVLVTRNLDGADAGIFFAATSAFVIACAVARLGVPTGVVYFLSRLRATHEEHRLRPVVQQAAVAVALLSVLLAVAGIVLAPQLADLLAAGARAPEVVTLVRLLAAFVLVASLNDVAVGVTRGYGTVRPFVLVERITRPLLQLLLAGAALAAGARSPLWLGLAWVAPYAVSAVVLGLWSSRLRRTVERRAGAREHGGWRAEVATFWRFTAPRSVAGVTQMLLQRADILLLAAMRGPAEAAVYTAATRFLVFGQLGGGAISTAVQPKIAALVARDDISGAQKVYRAATVWLVLASWPVYLLSAVFAPQLLTIFGADYARGTSTVIVLSLTMLVATACGAVDVVLMMAGRSSWTMANSLVALAVNLALNLLLIPPLGIFGAALAWSASILVGNLLPLAQLARHLHLHPFGRPGVVAMGLAAGCFGLAPALAALASWTAAAVVAALGACVYTGAVWRHRRLLDLHQFAAVRRRSS